MGEGKERLRGNPGARLCGYDDWRCACSQTPTPHLTSPLRGGRDELGEGVGVGAGSVGGKCERALVGCGEAAEPDFAELLV